jgi:hypothetical protein
MKRYAGVRLLGDMRSIYVCKLLVIRCLSQGFRYSRNSLSRLPLGGRFLPLTVVADNKKRVTLRLAKPGDRFDVQVSPEGKFILTKLEHVREAPPAQVLIEKRGDYHVGVLDRPIDMEALKEALADFP